MSSSLLAQERVEATGVGVADTKVKACEIALDHARREAAQSATAIVSAKYQSTETDKGISHRQDQISTTKAFAKLIDKKESFALDDKSGLIKCDVVASFSAGFVKINPIEKIGSSTTEVRAVAFKSGEPFCSSKLTGCFREYYSKELDVFGIQVIRGSAYNFALIGMKDHKQKYFLITEVSGKSVKSKEKFIQLMKVEIESDNPNYILGHAKGHVLSKRGYEKRVSTVKFFSAGRPNFNIDFSKREIEAIDTDIQKTLDLAAEF